MAQKKIIRPLKERYNEKLKKELMKNLKIENIMAVPNLEKIVINIGAGKAKEDEAFLNELQETLALITGQKPITTKSKDAISNFKIRKGMKVGIKVTLRGERMWYFFDKLVNIVLPRTKDFRGVSEKSFDSFGNYSLGIKDQTIFPEIDTSKNIRIHGLQVCINTTTQDDKQAYELLKILGMPFRNINK